MSIEINNINKKFGNFTALRNINLEIKSGELIAMLGPSGSGKSTLLRIIAGLEQPDSGTIHFYGEDNTHKHIRDRHVGFVFQHYALFKHMTVFDNIAFGLTIQPKEVRPSKKEIEEKVTKLLKLIQLDWTKDRYPHQLSGGQRQRVALARVLAIDPKLFLLDEPFGALDAKVRKELRRWLRQLHQEIHITSIFVTHDQEEALEVADRIIVMNAGKIEQIGTPEEIYEHPANQFVFNFLGNVNLFHGRIDNGVAHIEDMQVQMPEHGDISAKATGYVRPHDIEICKNCEQSDGIKANICKIRCMGPTVKLELQKDTCNEVIDAELSREEYQELDLKNGDAVLIKPKKLKVFINTKTTQ